MSTARKTTWDRTALAQRIATAAHEGQERIGGQPYIEHPRRVAAAVEAAGWGPSYVQAAWLHDVVEDSQWTLYHLRSAGFSDDVVSAVDSVTRRKDEDYFDVIRRAAANQIGCIVKWYDNADNSGWEHAMEHLTEEQRVSRGERYARARKILSPAVEAVGGPCLVR